MTTTISCRQRCPPSPYERTGIVAKHIAVRFKYWANDKGVIVQDQNDDSLPVPPEAVTP